MTLHVVVGAGPIGTATAELLVRQGHTVRIVSRTGGRSNGNGLERIAVDANDTERLTEITKGAEALYNCANPPYDRWSTEWPPLAASLLRTAERTGAVLVTMSNLYGYGPTDHTMSESDPLRASGVKGRIRATMWTEALRAHADGRVRATEARASDYFGPGVRGQSLALGERTLPPLLQGRPIHVFGDPDSPHSWTYVPDIAATLARLATDPRAWGRAWHVPTNPPESTRDLLDRAARIAGVAAPRVRPYPGWQLRLAGWFDPVARELPEIRYQFDRPFVIDSSRFETTFGARPTSMNPALRETLDWWTHQRSNDRR